MAALRWADVDLSAGGDIIVVTVPGSKTNPAEDGAGVRQLVGGCAAALRRQHAATKPAPADSVIGLGVHQIDRRFAAACAAAGLEGRRTPHGGRVGLAVELTARGASTRDVQLAGGWKNAGTVAPLRGPRHHRRRRREPVHAGTRRRQTGRLTARLAPRSGALHGTRTAEGLSLQVQRLVTIRFGGGADCCR